MEYSMGFLDFFKTAKVGLMPTLGITDSILPEKAVNLIQSGILPAVNVRTLLLNKGEVCRFVDKAYLIQIKVITRNRRKNQGVSIRVTKRMTYHTGDSTQVPMEQRETNFIPGYLYITDKRIIFVSKEFSQEEKFESITAVIPYSNAVCLQFPKKKMEFLLPRPELAEKVIRQIKLS
jgi:hypothetical protein